jgi:ubiquinone biosynthesis protein
MVHLEGKGDLTRFADIMGVLMKYELSPGIDVASKRYKIINLLKNFPFYKRSEALNLSKPERLRMFFEELGPIFIKFGQMMSTRADLFNKKYITELSRLQDNAPPVPWKEAEAILKKELGRDIDKVFDSIDSNPIASASLGQVHEAILKDGTQVVIKIQRPNMLNIVDQDLRLMRRLTGVLLTSNPDWEAYNFKGLLEEFDIAVHRELNYQFEGNHADKFRKNFENDPNITAPKIFWAYSTERILVMEYIKGVDLKYLIHKKNVKRNYLVAHRFIKSYLDQIFEYRFFHADPHPSNVLVLKDNTLCYLDFGMMKYVSREFSRGLGNILYNILTGEIEGLVDDLVSSGVLKGEFNREKLVTELEELYVVYYQSKEKPEVTKGLEKILQVFEKYKMHLPSDYSMLIRAFIIVEGVSKQLDPQLNLADDIEQYLTAPKSLKYMTTHKLSEAKENVDDVLESFGKLPKAVTRFAERIAEGQFKVEFNSLPEFTRELEKVSTRISASILLAAMIIASAVIIYAEVGPSAAGFPILGTIIFMIAILLGFWMVVRVIPKVGI